MVDANYNRAMEGMRTVEDVLRFGSQSVARVARCRRIRHAIAATVEGLSTHRAVRISARDTRQDVGRRAMARRSAPADILWDNLQRTKEALRVLEECARALKPRAAARFQALRFRVYQVEYELATQQRTVRHHRSGRARKSVAS
jgi:thiamine-phosphate pyrophosphorylase